MRNIFETPDETWTVDEVIHYMDRWGRILNVCCAVGSLAVIVLSVVGLWRALH